MIKLDIVRKDYYSGLLRSAGLEPDEIELVLGWENCPSKRRRQLLFDYTNLLETVIEVLRHLVVADKPNLTDLKIWTGHFKKIMGPERVEYMDSMYAPVTRGQR